jgi:DnaK suppressor protein
MIDTALLKTLERRLGLRAAQLRQEITAMRQRNEERALAEVGDGQDAADFEARVEVADAEVERDLAELREIRAARTRMKDGGYGSCLDCDEDIDPHRLLAQPQALRCVACQDAAERRPATQAGSSLRRS